MAVLCDDRAENRKVNLLCHIVQFRLHIGEVTTTFRTIMAHVILCSVRLCEPLLYMSLVTRLPAGLPACGFAKRPCTTDHLVLHLLFGRGRTAVAGVLVRFLIFGKAFAKRPVFIPQPFQIAVQGMDLCLLRIDGFTHRTHLTGHFLQCL